MGRIVLPQNPSKYLLIMASFATDQASCLAIPEVCSADFKLSALQTYRRCICICIFTREKSYPPLGRIVNGRTHTLKMGMDQNS